VFLTLSIGCASAPPPHVVKPDLAFESRALTDFVEGTAFSPDSSLLATAHADGRIRLFSVERAKEVAAFGKDRSVLIRCLRFTPEGAGLITLEDRMEGAGTHGRTLRRWHLGGGSLEWSKDDPECGSARFETTPDGKGIVVRHENGWALRDASTGELVGTASERDDLLEGRRIRASLVSIDGRSDVALVVRDASGKELARLVGPFRTVAASPDGATVAAISNPSPFHDADIALFDAPTLHERARIAARDPDSALFAPGGRLVVRARDETLVIDPASGEVRGRIPTGDGPTMLLSPDGALAAVEGKVVRVFEVATGREVASLEHSHLFRPVQFLRGGRRLVVQGASVERPSEADLRARADFARQYPDHTSLLGKLESDDPWNVRIWDVVEGRELVRYEEPWGASVRVAPDETHLAVLDGIPIRAVFLAPIPR
jgi:WD40 repeat protein